MPGAGLRNPPLSSRKARAMPMGSSPPGNSVTPSELRFRSEVRPEDADTVRRLARATRFFSAPEVAVAVELVEEHRLKGMASGYEFVFADCGSRVIAYTCFGPIPCAQGSYDLYWIVVDPACQGQGIGRALLERSELLMHEQGGRCVYIETSARAQYVSTQAFYRRCGYHQAALLDDFYAPGDGKIIYRKALESVPPGAPDEL